MCNTPRLSRRSYSKGGFLLLATALICSIAATVHAESPPLRQRTLLDADWLFHRREVSNSNEVIQANFDDHDWQQVNLPHDYVLDGTYAYSPERWTRGHGYLPYEVGWYRKRLSVPQSAAGKILRLDFDGAFRDSQVWLNGEYLGRHPSGYTPFSFDVTQVARPGAENILVVRVDPSQWEGWWYEGGGIYRHVYLTEMSPLHIAQWGSYVTSKVPDGDKGADAEADLTIQTTIENNSLTAGNCEVDLEIIGPDGALVKTIKSPSSRLRQNIVQQTVLRQPKLWSLESPSLYQLRTTILQDGKPVDSTITTFGIRTIRYDAEKGFFLNGRHVEIQGAANHQDLPGVGTAVPDSLQTWRVEQLKKMGCNAWRTAHNPPNEALLDACDRLGMLVMDENRHLGDSYVHHSPHGTTATNFSDLATMIQRDRNHPSVIMWSMCNEETMQGTSNGAAIFSEMMKVVHGYDTTRPITSAMNGGWLTNGDADVEDIVGANYAFNRDNAIHKLRPGKAIFGSEDLNEKTTRGQYADDPTNGMRSCYHTIDAGWTPLLKRPFDCGAFVWTGFDYKGEPNPYGWPDVANNTGLMDSCGFPKDKYYYYESCWSDKPMVHLLPDTWNWPGREGKLIRVIAFSNAKQVELFLNGKSLGAKDFPRDGHIEWKVPYQPGRLEAKAFIDEKTVATEALETTGPPARVELSPDRTDLHADGEDAVIVPVSILDAEGRVVPDAANRVSFELSGGGHILGVGNGNPADHDSDRASGRNAFHGHCIVILQASPRPSTLRLTVTSADLPSVSAAFNVR